MERQPRHHFGMSEIFATAPHFPDSFVWLLPLRFKKFISALCSAQSVSFDFDAGVLRVIHRAHYFAINIQLKLLRGRVADPHRLGIFVPASHSNLEFLQAPFALHAVDNLHLRRAPRDSAQEPVPPRTRFLDKTRVHQSEKGEGRIAQPAIPIIPVAHAADFFRQRSRRRRDDATGGRVGESFERDERTHHRVAPLAARDWQHPAQIVQYFSVSRRACSGMNGARRILVRRKPGQRQTARVRLSRRRIPPPSLSLRRAFRSACARSARSGPRSLPVHHRISAPRE